MADSLTKERRSWNMSRVCSKNTKPELFVRSILHCSGYRFRLHNLNLPGKPDIVLAKYRTIIFVHGCFWHRHKNCKDATVPKSRTEFWLQKFSQNVERDEKARLALSQLGWKVLVVWECETLQPDLLLNRLKQELEGTLPS
jgi:DNA mismatch endonuclease (patch repair protein)